MFYSLPLLIVRHFEEMKNQCLSGLLSFHQQIAGKNYIAIDKRHKTRLRYSLHEARTNPLHTSCKPLLVLNETYMNNLSDNFKNPANLHHFKSKLRNC